MVKTPVANHTLHPIWNKEWLFEIPEDSDWQDLPLVLEYDSDHCSFLLIPNLLQQNLTLFLVFSVWDKDLVSSDNIIGTVVIDLDNLLTGWENEDWNGWFPIYDSVKGQRGEINISISVDFIRDYNPAKGIVHSGVFFSSCLFHYKQIFLPALISVTFFFYCSYVQLFNRFLSCTMFLQRLFHLLPGRLLQ